MNDVFERIRFEISEAAAIPESNLSNPAAYDGIIEFEWHEDEYFASGQMELVASSDIVQFGDVEERDGDIVIELMYMTSDHR